MSPKINSPKADTSYLLLCTSSKVAVALDTSRAVAASALVEEEEAKWQIPFHIISPAQCRYHWMSLTGRCYKCEGRGFVHDSSMDHDKVDHKDDSK